MVSLQRNFSTLPKWVSLNFLLKSFAEAVQFHVKNGNDGSKIDQNGHKIVIIFIQSQVYIF